MLKFEIFYFIFFKQNRLLKINFSGANAFKIEIQHSVSDFRQKLGSLWVLYRRDGYKNFLVAEI